MYLSLMCYFKVGLRAIGLVLARFRGKAALAVTNAERNFLRE